MRLLLSSAGITNQTLAGEIEKLVGKTPGDTRIGFIPTAANLEVGNKVVAQLTNLQQFGYAWIDIVDPSAAGTPWSERLAEVDVIFVSGGNTFHLLDQYRKTGFGDWLNENIENKVYVGVSAGTIVACPDIQVAAIEPGDPNTPGLTDLTSLSWVDFYIEPHCDADRREIMRAYAAEKGIELYTIDDASAVVVDEQGVRVVGEGEMQGNYHYSVDGK